MKKNKMALIFAICIVVLISLVACNGEATSKELSFKIAYANTQNDSDVELVSYIINQASATLGGEMLTAKVDSVQELIDLSNTNRYPFFDINFNPYFSQSFREEFYNSHLSKTIRAYDDLFFQEKTLIMVFFYFPNYWVPARIESISIKGDVMNIVIARPDENSESESDALSEHAFLIEVAKKDITDVNEITKQIIRKGKIEDYTEIATATTNMMIDMIIDKTKESIDAVQKEVDMELNEILESQVKADYIQQFGNKLLLGYESQNKFYGLYSGAVVLFIPGEAAALKSLTISGVEFSYYYDWTIWVWKDNVFYNLENIEAVFEAKILSQKDLEAIGVIHAKVHA